MMTDFPLLSLAIWCPILIGVLVLLVGRDERPGTVRALALAGSVISFCRDLAAALFGFDRLAHGMQFVEKHAWIARFKRQLPFGHRRHFALVRGTDRVHYGAGRDCELGSDQGAHCAIHGRVPDPVRHDDRRVLRARWLAVLRVL